jgi:hypothetical protein
MLQIQSMPLVNPQLSHTIAPGFTLCAMPGLSAKDQDIMDRLLWPVPMATKTFHGIKSWVEGMMALQDFICIPSLVSPKWTRWHFSMTLCALLLVYLTFVLCFAGRRRDTGVRTTLLHRTTVYFIFTVLQNFLVMNGVLYKGQKSDYYLSLSLFDNAMFVAKKCLFVWKK